MKMVLSRETATSGQAKRHSLLRTPSQLNIPKTFSSR